MDDARSCERPSSAFLRKFRLPIRGLARIVGGMWDPTIITKAEARATAAGLTVQQLCEKSGVHRATWQRWKAGKSSPTMGTWDDVERTIAARERAIERTI